MRSIFRDFGGEPKFAGPAETIKCFEDNSLVAELVDTEGRGRVLVVDGGGSMRCGLFGDNLAMKAIDHGWSGVVVFGCIRDADIMGTLPIGVKALGVHPEERQAGGRRASVPLRFADADWHAGDYVYADLNGSLSQGANSTSARCARPKHLVATPSESSQSDIPRSHSTMLIARPGEDR